MIIVAIVILAAGLTLYGLAVLHVSYGRGRSKI